MCLTECQKYAGTKLQDVCQYEEKNSWDKTEKYLFVKHIFGLVYYLSTARNSPFDVRCYTYGKRSFVLLMFQNTDVI
jgi:hypothetical protein